MLTDRGRISVEDAAERLDVSQATIRRDFDQLAQQQMITRTRGGAVVNGVSYDLPLRYKSAKHAPEKQRIGAMAASLVEPATVAGLTGGTTTTEVARALAARPDLPGASAAGARRFSVSAGSAKLGRDAFARVCTIEKVHALDTDAQASDKEVAPFLAAGIEVLCV